MKFVPVENPHLVIGADRAEISYNVTILHASFCPEKDRNMGGCLKGKSETKEKHAKVSCGKCGALAEKKGHVCQPVKLKEKEGKTTGSDKKKKEKK